MCPVTTQIAIDKNEVLFKSAVSVVTTTAVMNKEKISFSEVCVCVRGLTFFFSSLHFGSSDVPVEDEFVEAQLVVQGLFRVLQREHCVRHSVKETVEEHHLLLTMLFLMISFI